MSDRSAIEWCDASWNPATGCDRTSPGCARCYALDLAPRLRAMGVPKYRRARDGGRASGPAFGVTLHPGELDRPRRWRRPRRIFVNSMSDLFHEEIPFEFVDRVFATMAACPRHTFQVLTKRPERMLAYCEQRYEQLVGELDALGAVAPAPWPNVWLGVSVENRRWAWRVDVLRDRLGSARPERYVPAHLLREVLSAARRAGDGKAARCLERELRRRAITGGDAMTPRRERHCDRGRVLDADVGEYALQVPAVQRSSGRESAGLLPVWVDMEGRVRIAVGKPNARHASDFDQIIVEPEALLRGIGTALRDAEALHDDETAGQDGALRGRLGAALAQLEHATQLRSPAPALARSDSDRDGRPCS